MGVSRLFQKVGEGVLSMKPGTETTVGKVATIESVSKSPQLYAIFQQLVDDGYLTKTTRYHSNGREMFVFVRTEKAGHYWPEAFGSKGF